YVPNSGFGETPGTLSAIDLRACTARNTSGCARTSPAIPTGRFPNAVAVDPTTHVVYTADLNHSTSTIVKNGRAAGSQAVGFFPWRVAVDRATDTVWVTDNAEGRVSLFATR